MDKNIFTGLFLIALILIAFSYFSQPSKQALQQEKHLQDSLKAAKAGSASQSPAIAQATATATAAANRYADSLEKVNQAKGPFGTAYSGKEQFITLENDVMKLELTTRGGRIYSAVLKKFKTYDGKPLVLLNGPANSFGLNFDASGKAVNTAAMFFNPVQSPGGAGSPEHKESLTLRLPYSEGKYLEYTYGLKKGSYVVDFTVNSHGLQDIISSGERSFMLKWKSDMLPQEKDLKSELIYTTVVAKDSKDDIPTLKESKDDKERFENPVQWVSFKQKFFSAVLISPAYFPSVEATSTEDKTRPIVKTLTADIALPYNHQPQETLAMRMYLGPNDFAVLKNVGVGLEQEIPLGWGPLKWINRYAVIPVFDLLSRLNLNYGIIILILTILLKLILFPLTYRSYLSTAKMRVIKPEIDEIKEKVGESDPTRLQQEYLKLYKKAGVNPLGGCLPVLLQMPILFAFLRFFPNAFQLRQQKFLFMEDLSTYDSFIHWTGNIPVISSVLGNHLSLMCLLMSLTTVIYSLLNTQVSPGGPAGNQYKYMSYIFPIMSIAFLNNFSAGLNYYYFCANIITFSQQALIGRFVNDDEIHRRIQENKKKPVINKKSKFMAAMEEMSKQKAQPKIPVKPLSRPGGRIGPVKK